jgi:hypothetical protein
MEWCPYLFVEQPGVMEDILKRLYYLNYSIFHTNTLKQLTLEKLNKITPKKGSINILLSVRSSI